MHIRLYQGQSQKDLASIYYQKSNQVVPYGVSRELLTGTQSLNKTGHWTQKQNAKYFAFLRKFKEKFSEKESRRQWKVFKALSEFVKTRNANQCRSHHHKMQKNFNTVQETLEFLKKKTPSVQKKCQKYTEQLEKIQSKIFIQGNGENNQKFDIQENGQQKIAQNVQIPSRQDNEDHGLVKKIDIGNLKTGIGQENEYNILYYHPLQCLYQPSPQSYKKFPSTGIVSSLSGNSKSLNKYLQMGQDYLTNKSQNDKTQLNFSNRAKLEEKVLECHQYFLRWYTKASHLIFREQEELRRKCNLLDKQQLFNPYY